jgi:LysM domain-containing protein
MSDRGLPVVDGAQACPFVAFENDRDERATSPDQRHRCYAEVRPAPRALAHQEAYCLASTFPACPTFQDWARREAAQARAGGGAEPFHEQESAQRNPPRDWSAPPPWAGGAAVGAGAAGSGPGAFDGYEDQDEEDPPGFLSSRSAAAGAGLAGSTADRLAGSARGEEVTGEDSRYGPTSQPDQRPAVRLSPTGEPDDDRFDHQADEPYDDSEEDEFERRGRPRSARASGGIGFGRDRRPRVGATRRAQGWDEAGPSWERPRHHEPYPVLKSRMGLPRISRLGGMAIALALAAIALFFLPQFLGLGGTPSTGDRTTPRPGSAGPSGSLEPTPVPAPTPQVYVVKSGDTMSSIAKQLGVPLDALIAANREEHPNPDTLQIGDQLIIPSSPPGGSPSPS